MRDPNMITTLQNTTRRLAIVILLLLFISLMTGCVSNIVLLETRANDPIMMNLLDNDADLAQIEDGTGFVGEATACPT
jgi:hypothetical protein